MAAKTKCMITKLPTVSVNFGYSEKVFFLNRSVLATAEADSHCASQRGVNDKVSIQIE